MSYAISRFDALGNTLTTYAGRRPDADNKVLTVYYVGDVPEQARKLAVTLTGVEVVLKGGSRFTLSHALDAAWGVAQDKKLAAVWQINGASPNPDGSGITVDIAAGAPDPDAIRAAEERFGIPGGITIIPNQEPPDWATYNPPG
jgi:hypothetical protein